MAGGRPTKYKPEFCEKVIGFGKEGMGRAEIAAELDVVRDTLAHWETEHEEFLGAMNSARDFSLAWWAKQGRLGVWDQDETIIDEGAGTKTHIRKRLNANAYSLQVRNRFPADYQDKKSVDGAMVVAEANETDGKMIIRKIMKEINGSAE